MRAVALMVVAALAAGGCYESHQTGDGGMRRDARPPIPDGSPLPDAPPPPDTGPPPLDAGSTCEGGRQHLYVMSLLEAAREESPGVADGFNLDGVVSNGSEPEGCFQPDFRGPPPDRTRGVDNQLGILAPTLESALGEDLDLLSRDAIASGRLIVLIQLRGVNDFTDDECVEVVLRHGRLPAGVRPRLGPDGRLALDQAFIFESGTTQTLTGSIVSGRLHAQADHLQLELPVGFERLLELPMDRGNVRLSASRTRISMGVAGGSMRIEPLVEALLVTIRDIPPDLLRSTLEGVADLDPDRFGICDSVSMAFRIEAVRATRAE